MEPLKWKRRKEENDYVATDTDGTTYVIWGGSGAWDISRLNGERDGLIRNREGRPTPDYHTLGLAKLAVEVLRVVGVEALFEHRVDARTILQGGGWGGHPRTFLGKASCTCGWKGPNDSGVREARISAAWHLEQQFMKMLTPEKVV
jgi:hypothetical protein